MNTNSLAILSTRASLHLETVRLYFQLFMSERVRWVIPLTAVDRVRPNGHGDSKMFFFARTGFRDLDVPVYVGHAVTSSSPREILSNEIGLEACVLRFSNSSRGAAAGRVKCDGENRAMRCSMFG